MIPIVAHGIIGTAYRKDVVVDGGVRMNNSLGVLHDIKHNLSSCLDSEVKKTGWAMVPATTGTWLSHIELAFDANYNPAYIAISLLIPSGKTIGMTALNLISKTLVANHSKYIRQEVILHSPQWDFLLGLGTAVEEMLGHFEGTVANRIQAVMQPAYWPGDLPSMLDNMWSRQIQKFSIVYCGYDLLSTDKSFLSTDQEVPASNVTQTATTTSPEVDGIGNGLSPSPSVTLKKSNLGNKKKKDISQKKKLLYAVLGTVFAIGVIIMVIVLSKPKEEDRPIIQAWDSSGISPADGSGSLKKDSTELPDIRSDEKPSSNETEKDIKGMHDSRLRAEEANLYQKCMSPQATVADCDAYIKKYNDNGLYENRCNDVKRKRKELADKEEQTAYNKCMQENATLETLDKYLKKYEKNTSYKAHVVDVRKKIEGKEKELASKETGDSPSAKTTVEKKEITNVIDLFDALKWENIADFDKKYSVISPHLKRRKDFLLRMAIRVGEKRYEKAYNEIKRDRKVKPVDRLTKLETALGF